MIVYAIIVLNSLPLYWYPRFTNNEVEICYNYPIDSSNPSTQRNYQEIRSLLM